MTVAATGEEALICYVDGGCKSNNNCSRVRARPPHSQPLCTPREPRNSYLQPGSRSLKQAVQSLSFTQGDH